MDANQSARHLVKKLVIDTFSEIFIPRLREFYSPSTIHRVAYHLNELGEYSSNFNDYFSNFDECSRKNDAYSLSIIIL